MNRRKFLAGAVGTVGIWQIDGVAQTKYGYTYESETITVELIGEDDNTTSILLTEKGDADYAIINAFYYAVGINGFNLVLSKEISSPISKLSTFVTDIPLPVADIVFIRVKELKLLNENKFGEVPNHDLHR